MPASPLRSVPVGGRRDRCVTDVRQVAMIMGYAQYDTEIWTHKDSTGEGEKLAMCCTNSM